MLHCGYNITGEDRADGVLTVRAPAKINWTLRVLGRRSDGYHDIESLVSPVSLYDDLSFSAAGEAGVRLFCDVPDVPVDENNLIIRAARRLAEVSRVSGGVECRLTKRIPVGGGLGGGSSNAASTLTALNRLWRLDWPVWRLAEVAAELGSDVPLFLHGGAVIMTGRGERIRPARLGWQGWVVLVFPGIPVSTAAVYKAWRPAGERSSGPASGAGHPGESEPGVLSPEQFAKTPSGAVQWMEWTFNMLEEPALEVCPVLGELVRRLTAMASRPVRVSGSGSTLFTAFDSRDEAERMVDMVARELGLRAGVVRPIVRAEAQTAARE